MAPPGLQPAASYLEENIEGPLGAIQACARCGAEDDLSARFCRRCGSILSRGAKTDPRGRLAWPARIVLGASGFTALVLASALTVRLLDHGLAIPPSALLPRPEPAAAPPPIPSAVAAPPARAALFAPISKVTTDREAAVNAPAESAQLPAHLRPSASAVERIIGDPVWTRRPSARDISEYYPIEARKLGLSGATTLDCVIAATGQLRACSIVREFPRGLGFGRATLEVARHLQIRTETRAGESAVGRRLRFPIRWRLKE